MCSSMLTKPPALSALWAWATAMKKKAPDFVTKKDKQRANYYNFYSNNRWDDLQNYDLTIDTSRFSVDLAVDMIIDAAKLLDV